MMNDRHLPHEGSGGQSVATSLRRLNTVGKSTGILFEFNKGEQNMKSSKSWMRSGLVLAIGTVCIAFARSAGAQVQTTTTTTAGQSSQVVKVDRGEVLAVEGNDLIVRMADGSIRHFENIPETAKATE
jgi:hypothetical protein